MILTWLLELVGSIRVCGKSYYGRWINGGEKRRPKFVRIRYNNYISYDTINYILCIGLSHQAHGLSTQYKLTTLFVLATCEGQAAQCLANSKTFCLIYEYIGEDDRWQRISTKEQHSGWHCSTCTTKSFNKSVSSIITTECERLK